MCRLSAQALLLCVCLLLSISVTAQDTVTGAFEGTVTDSLTDSPIAGATVQIINQQTGLVITKLSDSRGLWYQGLLAPGVYIIRVSAPGFQTRDRVQLLHVQRTGEVIPVPVALDPASAAAPPPTPAVTAQAVAEDVDISLNRKDARHDGSYTEGEVTTLPLGGTTLVRSFDELALLLPGVAPPPQTIGNGTGPGQGAGVGSAGQFAVNGLRSRGNNFTVDGSDNNDEDIGVRRQGFLSLIPQPIESIKEYQVITLLAPAQFGRNIGAQVNAVSKSGGNKVHGIIYGLFNSSQLNARNFFDTTKDNTVTPLRTSDNQAVRLNGRPIMVQNRSNGKDSFTFGQAGFVLGGPLKRERVFYFLAGEGQLLNATKKESFAVPTIEQRGVFGTGATGVFRDPFGAVDANGNLIDPLVAFPTTSGGDAIFSLFPFSNDPKGIYGPNTFTQILPASGRGRVLSAKLDDSFKLHGKQQSVTERYNSTDDFRYIPVTGGALFSTLKPRVRTENSSFFFNSEMTTPNSTRPIFNQVRLSYGRTRLIFEEVRDKEFQVPNASLPDTPFLRNAPLLENFTRPVIINGQPSANRGPVIYRTVPGTLTPIQTTEERLGPVGQVKIAGFSPVGVDVFNFPQRRVNNTYQVADTLTWRAGPHMLAFGADTRRTELNSELPRNSRPLITFNGAPRFILEGNSFRFANRSDPNQFIRPETFAAASAASGFAQTLATGGEAGINLRFYQLDFFAQDEWRIRPHVSISYGLRYEYNTPPREANHRIEKTFDDPSLSLVPGLRSFIGNRTQIFESDPTNFAPRLGIAYSFDLFGRGRETVIRAGYGLFYDQVLGAVVSQSRNVYPTYLTVDFAGGPSNLRFLPGGCPFTNLCPFDFINPSAPIFGAGPGGQPVGLVQQGTLNTLNPALSFEQLVRFVNAIARGGSGLPPVSGFGVTIPAQRLKTPVAHHYSFTLDQQLSANMVLSVAYVGTQGRHLLRFTTPNLGQNAFLVPLSFSLTGGVGAFPSPSFFGLTLPPGALITPQGNIVGGRPVNTVGVVNRFETTASSRYNALQLQARGRLRRSLQYQLAYTLSKASDDVSDVFDLAGASALPQNSLTLAGERGPANFDVLHRFSYNLIFDFPEWRGGSRISRHLLNGWQIAGTGQFQTGQPFTVNSIFDINLDGNLTDRLNTTNGIMETGDGRQPLRLTVDPLTLLAPIGQDGGVGRNTFRAGSVLDLDMSVIKNFHVSDGQRVMLRVDIFNFINRANFGIPVRYLEAPGFGKATDTVTPGRRVQFSLKYSF